MSLRAISQMARSDLTRLWQFKSKISRHPDTSELLEMTIEMFYKISTA
jgi:hypothetical protein